ncbi:replication protein A 70 kDa DNA-binding subunit [Artemisia annua]|uniref:Replication protein A 70 kDa DNA-binding subunit n=1 Tax=Artemisia annua TaxID=35608 RepID=A0A2U1LKR1_ARTAN|nr:replication protein A 70 kDa DNA-binding subunit [Artemisia annua]
MADQAITALSDIDPMLDDCKILVRVGLATKWEAGVGENGGKFPRYKIRFYKNTSVTRVAPFDQNTRGFRFEPFQNFTRRHFSETDIVGKPSVSNGAFATKLYLNDNIPEINTFKKMYQEMDGYVEKNIVLNTFSPSKKEITADEFFENGVRKMVGSIHESEYKCGCVAKEPEDHGESSSSKKKPKTKVWFCKQHKEVTNVGPRYKVIVRVIDDTDSASLLLYEDIITKLVDIPCHKLKAKYGEHADDIFPDELAPIVGKKLLFRFLYSSYNINNNNHVYQVKMISEDENMIKIFKHGFINEDNEGEIQTPVTPSVTTTKFNAVDNIPFNIESTPEVTKATHKDGGSGSSSGKSKRDVIDLDGVVQEDKGSKKLKNDVELPNLPLYIHLNELNPRSFKWHMCGNLMSGIMKESGRLIKLILLMRRNERNWKLKMIKKNKGKGVCYWLKIMRKNFLRCRI